MSQQLILWLGHPKPRPGESLSSWLLRTAWLNGRRPHSFCSKVWPKRQIWNRDVDAFSDGIVVARLAEGTGTPFHTAWETSLASLRGILFERYSPLGRSSWVMPLGIYHRTRLLPGNQFCPACLDEDPPYFRRDWRLALATCCPRHGIVLADRCGRCKAYAIPHRSRRMTVCHNCLADLRSTRTAIGDSEAIQFEHGVRATLDDCRVRVPWLREQHSLAFFNMLRQLLRVLSSGRRAAALRHEIANRYGGDSTEPEFPSGSRDIETLSPDARHRLMGLAARLMPGWPFRFVGACMDANVWSSWALRDLHNSSFVYTDAVHSYLYRPPYHPSRGEIDAARAYLVRQGRPSGPRALRNLLGIDSNLFTAPRHC